jgi:AhpD family alkylhydroperoxidase
MAAFGLVEYGDASPEVRAIYDDIMTSRGVDWINNFWKALAHDPALLRRTWHTLKEIMRPGELDGLTKELLYLAVSITNQCGYCTASHTAAAWKAGMNGAMFGELLSVVGMANETNRLASGYQVPVDAAFALREGGWKNYPAPRDVVRRFRALLASGAPEEALTELIEDGVSFDRSAPSGTWHEEALLPAGDAVIVRGHYAGGTRVAEMAWYRVSKGKIVEIHVVRGGNA